ncbi:hypothetical protein K440DRAFT_640463 [Wilcoxina mikolae CBS 423.85]|nr:hypothetical protein K440DRAFT_640463 [Wilcoxina mikolae CBS 423.85]
MSTSSDPASLLSLPTELLFNILSRLGNRHLTNTLRTCRRLYETSIPVLYAQLPLGYFAAKNSYSPQQSPLPTLMVLEALKNPSLARNAVFIDHVDNPTPTFTRTTSQRPLHRLVHPEPVLIPVVVPDPPADDQNGNQDPPAPPPLPPPPPPPMSPWLFNPDVLQQSLDTAMTNLAEARVQTIRIVSGSDALVQALLEYIVKRDCVRKLWLEDVSLRSLTHFLETTLELRNGDFRTGLTHLRVRKLKFMGSDRYLRRGIYKPNDDCIPRFVAMIISHSPNLTSLALDALPNLERLPEILDRLTFPNLVAFQLRSQIEDNCITPYYLSDKRLVGFLLRHPKIKAFGWPAENFVSSDEDSKALAPLIDQFSRQLVWFRSDCSLLETETFDHQSRYDGAPRFSRCFISRIVKKMEFLETIKFQGDYQNDELILILGALKRSGSSMTMRKFSLIRAAVSEDILDAIVDAMPNLRELKLCAYFTPGLVSLYDIAPQMVQEADGTTRANMTLKTFLGHIASLKHLRTLTIPLHSGLDISDRVISDIWDEYREYHPPPPSFSSHPHFKPLASEIDMTSPQPEVQTHTLDNGIEQLINMSIDLDAVAINPRAVVKHMLKCLRGASRKGGGLTQLRTIRCFFILALQSGSLDINEFMIDTEWREGPVDQLTQKMAMLNLEGKSEGEKKAANEKGVREKTAANGRLELRGTPVLAYGWGTGLWLGDTKSLSSRAWF